MATIFRQFYESKNAFLNPCDVVEKISDFPEVCITTFSESMINDFVGNNTVKIIANLFSANGTIPVYEIKYANRKMGLFLSRVGAPACAAGLEEIIVGVVGVLQFDVLKYRLENEYNVQIYMDNLPYEHIRWIENTDIDMDKLTGTSDMKKIKDLKGNPLLLFVNPWSIGMTLDRNEGLVLAEFGRN